MASFRLQCLHRGHWRSFETGTGFGNCCTRPVLVWEWARPSRTMVLHLQMLAAGAQGLSGRGRFAAHPQQRLDLSRPSPLCRCAARWAASAATAACAAATRRPWALQPAAASAAPAEPAPPVRCRPRVKSRVRERAR